ncbi:MAG TPA: long-chain fatty acid--CoA ligase [Clostridiales bacterium]|nr:long-chain fatty acid--CoA ligase [Clostridiales bacterium]
MPALSHLKYDEAWYAKPMGRVPDISLGQMLRHSARKFGSRTAAICLDYPLTYAQLDELSDRFATFLHQRGIGKGDRVATLLPNILQHLVVFFGIVKLGAISVPCNVMAKERELDYFIKDSGARAIVVLDMFYDVVDKVRQKRPFETVVVCSLGDFMSPVKRVLGRLLGRLRSYPIPYGGDPSLFRFRQVLNATKDDWCLKVDINPHADPLLILYTAGTTGEPKGVVLTHRNFIYNIVNTSSAEDTGPDDIALILFPMFHISGYILFTLPSLYIGGTAVLHPRFDAKEYLRLIDKYKVTLFAAPPTVYVAFLNHPEFSKYDVSSLRFAYGCGAPVPSPLQEAWNRATGLDLINGYGLTETTATAVTSLSRKKNLEPSCIGVPVGGEVAIIDEDGKIVPRGQQGEIAFRGPQVMKEYWNKPEETKKVFTKDGWFRTGDAGYMSEEGFTYFVERIKDLIIASGYNIAPAEIEAVIQEHPAVKESAVVSVPDEYRGETVKAFVVLREQFKGRCTEEEIIEFCRERMAAYKCPRKVEFISELPKSPTQKVLRKLLRERG